MEKKPELRLSGECMICTQDIPEGAKALPKSDPRFVGNAFRLNESSDSGNYHELQVKPDMEFFEHEGVPYARVKTASQVVCTQGHRHDPVPVPEGTYAFRTQLVYDPFEARLRAVAD